jgi:hypothetical protein
MPSIPSGVAFKTSTSSALYCRTNSRIMPAARIAALRKSAACCPAIEKEMISKLDIVW